ncbi:MAG: sulfotransferase family 2 domain-containing protein [Stagnimonas sp.]|nr:sulfotransferase family 2 domain-containing protein [Stagnimonas sp.]
MLVSHRHKFIYTKTRKTGGTSVESYFEPYCMAEGEWTPSHSRSQYVSASGIIGQRGGGNAHRFRWWNHMPASVIREQLGAELWMAYFKFCVVRNPYEKVVSMFFFEQRRGTVAATTPERAAADFERWVLGTELPLDREHYLINGQICMDAILRHETLSSDLEQVCRRLKLPWKPEALPCYKTGIRPPWAAAAALYRTPSLARIAEVFAYELDQFGYRAETPRC